MQYMLLFSHRKVALPSVALSQKHDVAVCSPAPFLCMITAVTASSRIAHVHGQHRRGWRERLRVRRGRRRSAGRTNVLEWLVELFQPLVAGLDHLRRRQTSTGRCRVRAAASASGERRARLAVAVAAHHGGPVGDLGGRVRDVAQDRIHRLGRERARARGLRVRSWRRQERSSRREHVSRGSAAAEARGGGAGVRTSLMIARTSSAMKVVSSVGPSSRSSMTARAGKHPRNCTKGS